MRLELIKKNKGIFLLFLLSCILFTVLTCSAYGRVAKNASALTSDYLPIIVLDPGHGGEDGGAVGPSGCVEKDINLAIALNLEKMLKASGFDVVMTRTTDISIYNDGSETIREKKVSDLHNRLKIIENQKNCIFVSIHQNKFTSSKYNGTQVFYSANNPLSEGMAKDIQNSVISMLQPDNKREVKPSDSSIYLLWNTKVPAVLVECGFLSNVQESQKLCSTEYQQKMSFSIYCGILKYWQGQDAAYKKQDRLP